MKNYYRTLLVLAFGTFAIGAAQAQSNTFPSTGNVGIGTNTPGTWFSASTVLQINGVRPTLSLTPTGSNGLATVQFKGVSAQSEMHLNFADGANTSLSLYSYQAAGEVFRINGNGNVGIGTANPDFKLTVNGKIKAEEIQVVVDVPADYVFEENYALQPLKEVEAFVKEHKHLPGVPSASEIKEQGWQVGEMNNKLLEKVEELTLHLIELNKMIQSQNQKIENQEKEIIKLKSERK